MILAKDMHVYDNHIDNFRYKHKLEQDKKYKLPHFSHGFRREKFIINDIVEDVYLSSWSSLKARNIHDKKITAAIMEFPESYVLMLTHWVYGNPNTEWYERLDHIPTWEEIEKLVRSDF